MRFKFSTLIRLAERGEAAVADTDITSKTVTSSMTLKLEAEGKH